MRSFLVVAFITIVAGAALYVAQRPTLAKGSVIADELLRTNAKVLKALECDDEVPVGVDGAQFWCKAHFKLGAVKRLHFNLDRAGAIKPIGEEAVPDPDHPIDPSDPWR